MFNRFRSRGMGYSLLLAASIAGCSYTPLSSINALRDIDPLTTPAKDMRFMVALPPMFLPQKGGVTMTTRLEATSTLPEQTDVFRLQPIPKGADERRVGQALPLYIYRIHPNDIPRFEGFRADKSAADGAKGSLSVDASVCLKTQQAPQHAAFTVYLKTAELQDYVPIVRNADIMAVVKGNEIDAETPLCNASNSVNPATK